MSFKQTLKDKVEQSTASDWEFFDTPQTWTLRDEDLVIEEVGIDGFGNRNDITQPDFASLSDPDHDEKTRIRLKHKGTPFDQLPALSLDGHRITMVQPNRDSNNPSDRYLSPYEVQIGQIMSQDDFRMSQGNTIDVEIR